MLDSTGDMGGRAAREPSLALRRMEERAIRERWPMPPERRGRILVRLMGTIDDAAATHREATAAAKVLLGADKLNMDAAKLDMELRKHEEFEARLRVVEQARESGGPARPGRTQPPQDR